MCGRIALSVYMEKLESRYGASPAKGVDARQWEPHYNFAPKTDRLFPIVVPGQEGTKISLALWGLLPSFVKEADFRKKYSTFNAKIETLETTRSYQPSLKKNRFCLVPISGFYEWKREGESKQPYFFKPKEDSVQSLVGLWSLWTPPEQNELVVSFSVLTRPPNEFMNAFHHRMPAMVSRGDESQILDPKVDPLEKIRRLLEPVSNELFDAIKVDSRYVNYGKNDPECMNPVAES